MRENYLAEPVDAKVRGEEMYQCHFVSGVSQTENVSRRSRSTRSYWRLACPRLQNQANRARHPQTNQKKLEHLTLLIF